MYLCTINFGTDLWNMTSVTSEEVVFHGWHGIVFPLPNRSTFSITKLPIKGSSELFWLCAMTSHLLDLHVSSHDTVPPRKLGLALTLDLAAKFDLVFKTPAIYLT